jgi:hypothetical protein
MANFCVPTIFILIPVFLLVIVGCSESEAGYLDEYDELWPKKSPAAKLYAECKKLSVSARFIEMIDKLKGQIPVPRSVWNENGVVLDYSSLLQTLIHDLDHWIYQVSEIQYYP